MNTSQASNNRRIIAGASMIVMALIFLANTLTGFMTRPASLSPALVAVAGFIAVTGAVLMTASILGLSHLLRSRADGVGLSGATCALVGWAVSTRISSVIQLDAVLRAGVEGVPASALESVFKSAPLVWASMFPVGLFFPAGLITLGIALFYWRPVNRWLGLLLALGGVLFPIGRAAGVAPAVVACDIVLATAFASIGWQILSRPEVWEQSSS